MDGMEEEKKMERPRLYEEVRTMSEKIGEHGGGSCKEERESRERKKEEGK